MQLKMGWLGAYFSFSGGFCPVSLPLFQRTRAGLAAVLASMTISFPSEGSTSLREPPEATTGQFLPVINVLERLVIGPPSE